MKSIKQKILMAGVALAIGAGSLGASAASDKASFVRQMELTDGNPGEYLHAQPSKWNVPARVKSAFSKTAAGPQAANAESRQFEDFENQLTAGDGIPEYTPSEHVSAESK